MMIFIDLVILLCAFGLIAFFGTQILWPLAYGLPLFPLLRKPSPVAKALDDAEDTLESLAEAEKLQQALTEINRRKAKLEGK